MTLYSRTCHPGPHDGRYWHMTLIEPIKALIRFIIWKLKGSKDEHI
jgi:hypothetical protein